MKLTKRERIKLLLKTRRDALEESAETGRAGQLGSRVLGFQELWREGSYREIEACLDYLAVKNPRVRWHLVHLHEQPHPRGFKSGYSDLGLDWLESRLSDVFVPQSVAENAGYSLSEAKAYMRPRRRAA